MMKFFKNSISLVVIFSALIATLGSFLFGYNSAVISGTLLFIKDEFFLSYWKTGFFVSSFVLGAAFGSAIGGALADSYGRKIGLLITSILFLVGTAAVVYLDVFALIQVGRIIQGIAVGIVSVIVPLYLSEISPIKHRGAIVSLNQLIIVFGVSIAYLVDYFFSSTMKS